MRLDPADQETAETLLRHYKAQKQVNCFRRRLCRAAESLGALGKAIMSEMEGSPDRLMAKYQGQVFSVAPANQVGGHENRYELLSADDLAALLVSYREACKTLVSSTKEVSEL